MQSRLRKVGASEFVVCVLCISQRSAPNLYATRIVCDDIATRVAFMIYGPAARIIHGVPSIVCQILISIIYAPIIVRLHPPRFKLFIRLRQLTLARVEYHTQRHGDNLHRLVFNVF
jgi:predicted membrane protein